MILNGPTGPTHHSCYRGHLKCDARYGDWLFLRPRGWSLFDRVATIVWLGPLPPRVVVMSTGAPGSDYAILAERYRDILRRSALSSDCCHRPEANVRRLRDPNSGVSVGFAQGGLISEHSAPDLRSLGTLFLEPFWFSPRAAAASNTRSPRQEIALDCQGVEHARSRFSYCD